MLLPHRPHSLLCAPHGHPRCAPPTHPTTRCTAWPASESTGREAQGRGGGAYHATVWPSGGAKRVPLPRYSHIRNLQHPPSPPPPPRHSCTRTKGSGAPRSTRRRSAQGPLPSGLIARCAGRCSAFVVAQRGDGASAGGRGRLSRANPHTAGHARWQPHNQSAHQPVAGREQRAPQPLWVAGGPVPGPGAP